MSIDIRENQVPIRYMGLNTQNECCTTFDKKKAFDKPFKLICLIVGSYTVLLNQIFKDETRFLKIKTIV